MRAVIIGLVLVLVAAPSFAQSPPCPPQSAGPLTFNPYSPSDLAIVRGYGGAVMSQVPVDALLKLDPYVPIEGELLRQVGGGIPWWPYPGYAPYARAAPGSPCKAALQQQPQASAPAPLTRFSDMLTMLQRQEAAAAQTPPAARADRAQGISIQFDGRTWISAGAAVPFRETDFVRVGQRGEFPIFRQVGADDDVIYIPTRPGMVAPFRAVPKASK